MIKKISFLILSLMIILTISISLPFANALELVKYDKSIVSNILESSENRIIVKFKPNIEEKEKELLKKSLNLKTTKKFSLTGSELVETTDKGHVKDIINKLIDNSAVIYAEPDYLIKTDSIPNDSDFQQLWGLENISNMDIDAPEAWDITTGTSNTVVAIIDEGIDISHPDISNNVWINIDEIPNDGIDNDGNGYIDDSNGWDFFHGDKTVYDLSDGDEHGTHVAGTIAAVANNEIGIVGVAPNVKIMPLKFMGLNGGYISGAIEAIQYAKNKGVRIANNSWGGIGYSTALRDAINSFNGIFVCSAGNNGSNNDINNYYPASYDCNNILSIAALDNNGDIASFSNYGESSVDIGAPGVSILSLKPNSSYQYMDGVSMAVPHVSGVLALLLSINPNINPVEACSIIRQASRPIGSLSGRMVSSGMINAKNAIQLITNGSPYISLMDPLNNSTKVPSNKIINIKFNENIKAGSNFSAIVLKQNDIIINSTININGDALTITPSGLKNGTKYSLYIPSYSIGDYEGNEIKNSSIINFTTENETIPPIVLNMMPVNGATEVMTASNIIIKFSENIQVADINLITVMNGNLKINFNYSVVNGNQLVLTPTSKLSPKSNYTVTIQPNSVKDAAGNFIIATNIFSFTTGKR